MVKSLTKVNELIPQVRCHFCSLHRHPTEDRYYEDHDSCFRKDADGRIDVTEEREQCTCWACFGMFGESDPLLVKS